MLIDTCRKTLATVGGDGYKEYVLYKRDEQTYELHYYSKYEYMEQEEHLAYCSDKTIADEAFRKIEELKLADYENQFGEPMTGGMRIVKFRKGEKLVRITSDNLPFERQRDLYEIEKIITKTADEAHRLD